MKKEKLKDLPTSAIDVQDVDSTGAGYK